MFQILNEGFYNRNFHDKISIKEENLMKVLEIKNNLVKILYDTEDKLVLAGFVVIEDDKTPYVAQIVSLKADNGLTYAIARLIFTFDSEGIVKNYNGSIPALNANVTPLSPEELLDILPIKSPVKLGSIAQQDFLLNVDTSILQNNLLICSDNSVNTAILVSNFAKQLENRAESSILIDTDGKFKDERRLVFGKHFKLPLNFETINFIYGNDLNDVDATSRAVIQDIFLEVQSYTRTIPEKFIPFDTFIDVVDQQYAESNIPELALLKNKLLKYKEDNVFAQSKYEISSLKDFIKDNYTVTLDISNVDAKLQREIIFYVYGVLEEMDSYITSFVKINDANSDKKLLKMLLTENKIYTNIICNHNYKYVYELKEKSDNLILFAPETTQHDFAAYNTFLNKLNHDEFIVWGKATQRIPLIVELAPIEIIKDEPVKPAEHQQTQLQQPETAQEETDEVANSVESEAAGEVASNVHPADDFTENEDTYTDLSDDIERKPPEEEDYSALSKEQEPPVEESEDNFEEELEKSSDELPKEPELELSEPEIIEENEEASTNNFFTEAELQEEPEVIKTPEEEPQPEESTFAHEEIIMPNGGVLEEEDLLETGLQQEAPLELHVDDLTITEPLQEEIESTISQTRFEPLETTQAVQPEPQILEEEPEIKEDVIEEDFPPLQEEILLPEPSIDERIPDKEPEITEVEQEITSETLPAENEVLEEIEMTPFENELTAEPAPLIQEDNSLNDELIEKAARDIDENFIYSKIEQDNIDDSEQDVLTEDDLNFIDDINNGGTEILEPQTDFQQEIPQEEPVEEPEADPEPEPQVVPVYAAKTPSTSQTFEQGDHVSHPKYGEGIIEKMIKYGSKTLCSINFANVGRRLLDPAISEISKL